MQNARKKGLQLRREMRRDFVDPRNDFVVENIRVLVLFGSNEEEIATRLDTQKRLGLKPMQSE